VSQARNTAGCWRGSTDKTARQDKWRPGAWQCGFLGQPFFGLDGKNSDPFSIGFTNLDRWPWPGLAMGGYGVFSVSASHAGAVRWKGAM